MYWKTWFVHIILAFHCKTLVIQNLELSLTKKVLLSKYLFPNLESRDFISGNKPQCTDVPPQSNLQIWHNSFGIIPMGISVPSLISWTFWNTWYKHTQVQDWFSPRLTTVLELFNFFFASLCLLFRNWSLLWQCSITRSDHLRLGYFVYSQFSTNWSPKTS